MVKISCEECKQWLLDVKTGTFTIRNKQRQPRAPGTPTPCWKCPKQSPEHAKRLSYSRQHLALLQMYFRSRATFGRSLSEAEAKDPIVASHFAMIDIVLKSHERSESARSISEAVLMSRLPNVR